MTAPIQHLMKQSRQAMVGLPPHEPAAFDAEVARTLAHDMGVLLAAAAGMPCYALVELGQCPRIDDRSAIALCVLNHGLEVARLFDGTPEAELADQGPWLIELSTQKPGEVLKVVEVLASHAGAHHALSLMVSPLPLRALADHLRSWLEGLIPPDAQLQGDEAMGAVLRWFDPRIGLDVPSCWPDEDRMQFVRAFRWWAAWQPDFSPRLMRGGMHNRAAPRIGPLPLDAPLMLALDKLNTPENMLAFVRENDIEPGELDRIAPSLQRWLAHRLLDDARRLGLTDWADRYMLLSMGLRLHPDIAEVEALHPVFAAAAEGREALGAAVVGIDPDRWTDLAEQAPQALALHSHTLLAALRKRRTDARAAHPFAHVY